MNFGMIILNQSIKIMQNCGTWINKKNIKTEDFYENIADKIKKRFDTSNYEVNRAQLRGKNKEVAGLMRDKLREKIMAEFVAVRSKTFSYLIEDGNSDKNQIEQKLCVIKRILRFNGYKNCLTNKKIMLKSQQRLKSKPNNVYTEGINKIALSSNNDKRLQTFDRITTSLRRHAKKNC